MQQGYQGYFNNMYPQIPHGMGQSHPPAPTLVGPQSTGSHGMEQSHPPAPTLVGPQSTGSMGSLGSAGVQGGLAAAPSKLTSPASANTAQFVQKGKTELRKASSGTKAASTLLHQSMRKNRQRSVSVWGGQAGIVPGSEFAQFAQPEPKRPGGSRRFSVTSVLSRLELIEPLSIPDESLLSTIEESELRKHCLRLDQLPQELSEVMRRYDLDSNGVLDRGESIHAAADLARMRHIIEQGIVHLEAFPPHAMYLLEEHDKDGDGKLTVDEMISAFRALERERNRRKLWMRFTLASVLFSLILLCALGGLLWFVLDASQESSIEGGLMVVKDTTTPVRTASVEFAVQDGVLIDRSLTNSCGDKEHCPIRVAEGGTEAPLSSVLSDNSLRELKAMKIQSGKSWMQLRVVAVARLEDSTSSNGSILVVYSHAGELTFDGENMSVTEKLGDLLRRSGFQVDAEAGAGGRFSLRGSLEVVGTYNSIKN